jgi:prepilin-type N-terminal cleavage/methylation domain-containing protein
VVIGKWESQTRHTNARRGRRLSGAFTLVELMIVIAIIAILAAMATPNLISARKAANEASAIGALKAVSSSQAIYREGDKERDGNLDYGMLTELSNTTLVDEVLGKGTKSGYFFSCTYSYAQSEFLWFAVSNPMVPRSSGDRYFETNVTGVMYYTTGGRLALDTNTCVLNATISGITPVGK